MSFQYSNYYDDDSDVDNGSVSSSGDEGGLPDDIVLSVGQDGKKRRFRLEKPRSRSSSRESSRERTRRDTDGVQVASAVGEISSSLSGMEEEMEKELDKTVEAARAEYNRQIGISSSTALVPGKHGSPMKIQKPSKQSTLEAGGSSKYDDVYFDSDEDEVDEVTKADEDFSSQEPESRKNRQVLSNDELFYDPDMDNADEKWVDNIRRKYQPAPSAKSSAAGKQPQKGVPLPNSDAVLNCPACMSLLCVDCQRHELYSHQYRAMFVFNCKVDRSQLMHYSEKPKSAPLKKRESRKRGHEAAKPPVSEPSTEVASSSAENPQDLYHSVFCNVCNTCVAMFDSDEVYHFFNVLASHA